MTRIVRAKEACAMLGGIGRVTLWRWNKAKADFPKPVRLSPGCVGWYEHELESWKAAQQEG